MERLITNSLQYLREGRVHIDKGICCYCSRFRTARCRYWIVWCRIPYYNKVLSPALPDKTKDGKNKAANIYADNNMALSVTFSAKFDYANGYVDAQAWRLLIIMDLSR